MTDARDGEILDGGWNTTVRRIGDVVHRSPHPWSRAVMALLEHLAEIGFEASPRPVGTGFDEDGNEMLEWVPGASPQPHPWSDDAASRIGELLSHLHRSAASFVPPGHPQWMPWFGRALGDATLGFGHGDLGPWNIMAVDGTPVGFVDWDTAGPVDPRWELAQVAWLNAQLHDDDVAERNGLGRAEARAGQLARIVDGYGLSRHDRAGFVDRMVELAVHSARNDAIEAEVTPETTIGVDDRGFPFVWAIAWQVRSASWMLRHRRLLERALGV